ncbi:methyltransferase, FxLD system [Streptomyces sp. HUAS MG91]|uniref:Protein-L-isoaspartate O-methyltransferase n=1 Tax=Streptomyces tabacisoli TaxID=3156398 RepID=A0AAU8J3I0_9ACTN
MEWQQNNITFTSRAAGHDAISERIGPALRAAQEAGDLADWWFMNKQPWPLRYRADGPVPLIERTLTALVGDRIVQEWTPVCYEPESWAFGGPAVMNAAHGLFHADSYHLLAYPPGRGRLGRRETAVLLLSAMMRGARLDWFEQGDVWAKVADLRQRATAALPARALEQQRPAMLRLMTVDAHSLARPDGPLANRDGWTTAFEDAGRRLGELAASGGLTRGLRAVIAHHFLFHANRAGLSRDDQHAISFIAREAVMGSSDNTASAAGTHPNADSVGPVNTGTITPSAADAEQLRNALVDQLQAAGNGLSPATEDALRSVPRHLFVPDASVEDAYKNATVHIKYDSEGTSISCASQPSVVARMLDQLQVQPGQRVLELGAGTGYNAALLAHLVGPEGRVTTIDVDDDLVEGARAHLAAAGITNVETITRDGALGHAEGAPYDRIIATVGAHGIPHAWLDQLAPGGRLVTPQRLKGSVSRSIAYEQRDGRWQSLDSAMNTFMPLRRGIADDDRRVIPLTADGTVRLQAPSGVSVDVDALADVLAQPRVEEWTGMTVRAMESPEWMELYLTCSLPSGLIRMLFPPAAKGTLLTEDPYPSSTAAVDGGAVTYLARRLLERTTEDGGKLWEFGVIGHGPGSDKLTTTLADLIRTWNREYRGHEATFEIQAHDAPTPPQHPGRFTLATPLNRIIVNWQ